MLIDLLSVDERLPVVAFYSHLSGCPSVEYRYRLTYMAHVLETKACQNNESPQPFLKLLTRVLIIMQSYSQADVSCWCLKITIVGLVPQDRCQALTPSPSSPAPFKGPRRTPWTALSSLHLHLYTSHKGRLRAPLSLSRNYSIRNLKNLFTVSHPLYVQLHRIIT